MNNPIATPSLRRDLRLLLLILLPCFLLLLGIRPLSVPDEGRYPEVAREMVLTGDYVTPRVNGIVFLDKPALYYWLQAVSYKVFGVSEWSVRLMPALFGVLGVAMVFITAWQLFSRRAAWWSAAALASNPLYFLASQYADMNIEIAVLVTCAICLFLLGRTQPVGSRPRRSLYWLAWMAIGFGILTKGLIGFVFPAMVVGSWVLAGWRWRELPHWYFVSGLLIVLAVCWPWFAAAQKANPQFLHYFFIYQQFERFSGTGFNNELPVWFYVPVILAGMLPWTLWLPKALYNQLRCAWGAQALADRDVRQMLLLWPALILVFFSIPASKIVGYILPVLPPLALLLGDYLDRRQTLAEASHAQPASLRATRFLPAVGALLILGVLVGALQFDRNSIRPLARELQSRMQAGDTVITYRRYYQDLPMYLHTTAPITVVDDWTDPEIMKEDNWRREFYLGLQNQPEAREWLIDEAAFAARLQSHQRIFVLASARYEQDLLSRYGLKLVARTDKAVLLSR